jgi:hypothetical protein
VACERLRATSTAARYRRRDLDTLE